MKSLHRFRCKFERDGDKMKVVAPEKRYVVTGDRDVTSVLTMRNDGAGTSPRALYDVTHLPCRTGVYTPRPAALASRWRRRSAFPVKPGALMPKFEGCNTADWAVLFVVGVEVLMETRWAPATFAHTLALAPTYYGMARATSPLTSLATTANHATRDTLSTQPHSLPHLPRAGLRRQNRALAPTNSSAHGGSCLKHVRMASRTFFFSASNSACVSAPLSSIRLESSLTLLILS